MTLFAGFDDAADGALKKELIIICHFIGAALPFGGMVLVRAGTLERRECCRTSDGLTAARSLAGTQRAQQV